jgi:hypothetical protein
VAAASIPGMVPITPVERALAGTMDDLIQRFKQLVNYTERPPSMCSACFREMSRDPYVPSARRLLIWTELAGRDQAWIDANASDLRYRDKGRMRVTGDEFETWQHSMLAELTRPSRPSESLGDWYDRLRRLHSFEFPSAREEPFWRWRFDVVSDLVHEGRGALLFGLPRSGKTALSVSACEVLAALKDEQIAHGHRSVLAQMFGKRVGWGGTPDSAPDERPSHLGLWYATNVRFISNFSIRDDEQTGAKSPIFDRWVRHSRLTDFMLESAKCERKGEQFYWVIDEGGFAADKFTQGSEKVKAMVGTTRIIGKLNGSILWITQFGPDDFPKEIVKSAETRVVLPPPRHGKAQGRATVTVPGTPLYERVLIDVPLPVSGFDTTDKPALDPDLSMKRAMQFMAEERDAWERAEAARFASEGGERRFWGREERAASLEHAVADQRGDPTREP